jgi:hypothetical protein
MKPNSKYFAVVRAVVFVLCVVALLSAFGNAETAHGKFKLPTETRWGKLLLAPGEYEFTITTEPTGAMVTICSKDSGWSGMILPEGISDPASTEESSLMLAQFDGGVYVSSLALGDLGMTLNFGVPKAGKVTRLVQPQPTEVASASGSH